MMADGESRVSFAMAEALAFGTLAIHRGIGAQKEDWRPAEGLNKGAYGVRFFTYYTILYYTTCLPSCLSDSQGHPSSEIVALSNVMLWSISPSCACAESIMLLQVQKAHCANNCSSLTCFNTQYNRIYREELHSKYDCVGGDLFGSRAWTLFCQILGMTNTSST